MTSSGIVNLSQHKNEIVTGFLYAVKQALQAYVQLLANVFDLNFNHNQYHDC